MSSVLLANHTDLKPHSSHPNIPLANFSSSHPPPVSSSRLGYSQLFCHAKGKSRVGCFVFILGAAKSSFAFADQSCINGKQERTSEGNTVGTRAVTWQSLDVIVVKTGCLLVKILSSAFPALGILVLCGWIQYRIIWAAKFVSLPRVHYGNCRSVAEQTDFWETRSPPSAHKNLSPSQSKHINECLFIGPVWDLITQLFIGNTAPVPKRHIALHISSAASAESANWGHGWTTSH